MCDEMTEMEKYVMYANVVRTIMTNILIERGRCEKYLLYNFNPTKGAEKLYYNVAAIASDGNREKLYLDMPFFSYLKFKFERKKRKNIRWFNPIYKIRLKDELKVSVSDIMNFIREDLNLSDELYDLINNEYYGWEVK